MSRAEFKALVDLASARYKPTGLFSGRFAYHFARGKLFGDPAFRHSLEQGLIGSGARVLDLGCGQGLLAALLLATNVQYQAKRWPADWARPPLAPQLVGIELMPADVDRARAALGSEAEFVLGDIARTPFPPSDVVVILDVLHYLPFEEQNDVLHRLQLALQPHGRLLLRIGDADGGFGFRFSNWVDRVVTRCRGHRLGRLYCRPLTEWIRLLRDSGFDVKVRPMSQGTLFSNVLLIADL
jgi:SAM-dependent methyltransferase